MDSTNPDSGLVSNLEPDKAHDQQRQRHVFVELWCSGGSTTQPWQQAGCRTAQLILNLVACCKCGILVTGPYLL